MKTITGGFVLAIVMLAGAVLCWREAGRTERVAAAYLQLATLQPVSDEDVGGLEEVSALPWPLSGLRADVTRLKATSDYWQKHYGDLPTGTEAGSDNQDAMLMFLSANSQFRSIKPPAKGTDIKPVVGQLDAVARAYASVLRADGSLADAAYNYEFVLRVRDVLSKGRVAGGKSAIESAPGKPEEPTSVDLPEGPTIHGHPGQPPADVPMNQFKAIAPMRFDEREAQPDAAPNARLPRKG